MKKIACCILFSFVIFGAALAQAEEIPEVIKSGFNAYKDAGPKAAIEAWVKGSGLDGSKEALAQANMFRQIEDYFGAYQGYDVFKSNSLGPKSHLYLITINYQKGALFAKFVTYKPEGKKEISQTFKFHTEVDQVWPSHMVFSD